VLRLMVFGLRALQLEAGQIQAISVFPSQVQTDSC